MVAMNVTDVSAGARELVVSPDAMVRFKMGRIFVHTRLRPAHCTFDAPAALELLSFFATPRTVEAARHALPQVDADWFDSAVQSLEKIGALVVAESPEAPPEPSLDHLGSLATMTHEVAADLLAFGPAVQAEIGSDTGVPVAYRIEAMLAGMDALRSELAARRARYVDAQLRQLGIDGRVTGLKLHLGAGPSRLAGWINIDAYPAELAMNLNWGLPFADGSASYVFFSHTLEHLYYPEEAQAAMKEIRRVLSPDGTLRVIVPDIEKCIQAYVSNDAEFYAGRRKTWWWWGKRETRLEDFLAYAGAGPRPGSFFESHKFGYDYETLRHLLLKTGFTQVVRSDYMQSADPVLRIDDASSVAGATYRDQHYSLFVEARP